MYLCQAFNLRIQLISIFLSVLWKPPPPPPGPGTPKKPRPNRVKHITTPGGELQCFDSAAKILEVIRDFIFFYTKFVF